LITNSKLVYENFNIAHPSIYAY